MVMLYMSIQFEFLFVYFVASVARVQDGGLVVDLDQVFGSVVVADENLRTVGTFVPQPAPFVDPLLVIPLLR